jgi:hypothetical protein
MCAVQGPAGAWAGQYGRTPKEAYTLFFDVENNPGWCVGHFRIRR